MFRVIALALAVLAAYFHSLTLLALALASYIGADL